MINGLTRQQVIDALVSHDVAIRDFMLANPAAPREADRPNRRALRNLAQELRFHDDEHPARRGRYAVEKCAAWLRGDGLVLLRNLFSTEEWSVVSERA